MATIAGIKSAAKTLLEGVTGVTKVETKEGGQSPWVKRAAPLQSYWIISVPSRTERGFGVGCSANQFPRVRLEGWMPHSYENPDSTASWDTLLESVCTEFRENRSLSLTVSDLGLPQIAANDYQTFAANDEEKAVRAHHCTIEMTIEQYITYTTA